MVGVDSWAGCEGWWRPGAKSLPFLSPGSLAGSAGCPVVGVMARGTWHQPNTDSTGPGMGSQRLSASGGVQGTEEATWLPNGAWVGRLKAPGLYTRH